MEPYKGVKEFSLALHTVVNEELCSELSTSEIIGTLEIMVHLFKSAIITEVMRDKGDEE